MFLTEIVLLNWISHYPVSKPKHHCEMNIICDHKYPCSLCSHLHHAYYYMFTFKPLTAVQGIKEAAKINTVEDQPASSLLEDTNLCCGYCHMKPL